MISNLMESKLIKFSAIHILMGVVVNILLKPIGLIYFACAFITLLIKFLIYIFLNKAFDFNKYENYAIHDLIFLKLSKLLAKFTLWEYDISTNSFESIIKNKSNFIFRCFVLVEDRRYRSIDDEISDILEDPKYKKKKTVYAMRYYDKKTREIYLSDEPAKEKLIFAINEENLSLVKKYAKLEVLKETETFNKVIYTALEKHEDIIGYLLKAVPGMKNPISDRVQEEYLIESMLRNDIAGTLVLAKTILNGNVEIVDEKQGKIKGYKIREIHYRGSKCEKTLDIKPAIMTENESLNQLITEIENNRFLEPGPENKKAYPIKYNNCIECDNCNNGKIRLECDRCKEEERKGFIKTKCKICNGKGFLEPEIYLANCLCTMDGYEYLTAEEKKCFVCGGELQFALLEHEGFCPCLNLSEDKREKSDFLHKCKKCEGTGVTRRSICDSCGGSGYLCDICNNKWKIKKREPRLVRCDNPKCEEGYEYIRCDCNEGEILEDCEKCGGTGKFYRYTFIEYMYECRDKDYKIELEGEKNYFFKEYSDRYIYEELLIKAGSEENSVTQIPESVRGFYQGIKYINNSRIGNFDLLYSTEAKYRILQLKDIRDETDINILMINDKYIKEENIYEKNI